MNKITALGCAFLLLVVTGCFFGDHVGAARSVSLTFPVPAGQSKISLSVSDTEVQGALKLIDGMLVSAGYVRDANPPASNERGLIVSYGPFCSVYLKDNKLDVGFLDYRARSSSARTRKTCNLLKDKLTSRYGAGAVKIEN